jgi:hypothetical protein
MLMATMPKSAGLRRRARMIMLNSPIARTDQRNVTIQTEPRSICRFIGSIPEGCSPWLTV